MCDSSHRRRPGQRTKPRKKAALPSRRALIGTAMIAVAALVGHAVNAETADRPNKPRRIVSLNLCTDDLVLRLADRANVASVSWLSRDRGISNVADLAMQVPINNGFAEQVIPLDPDLVFAGRYTARPAVALLKRAGFKVLEIDIARSLDEVRDQIRMVAGAVGEPERGERLIAEMDARLDELARKVPRRRLRVLVLNPNGFTSGAGSLVDSIIVAAGLKNAAADLGYTGFGQMPLEKVATSDVDVLILNGRHDGLPSLATELLHHPVLARLPPRTALFALPPRFWSCGGPAMVEAIERLSHIAAGLRATEPSE